MVCPICSGRGFVAEGFYSTTIGTWSSSGTATEKCRTCRGTGVFEGILATPASAEPVTPTPETVALNVALDFYGFGAPKDVIDEAVKLMLEYRRVVYGS